MNAPLGCLRPAIDESSSGGIRPSPAAVYLSNGGATAERRKVADLARVGATVRGAGSPQPAARRGVAASALEPPP
jgi:hypothetical protein